MPKGHREECSAVRDYRASLGIHGAGRQFGGLVDVPNRPNGPLRCRCHAEIKVKAPLDLKHGKNEKLKIRFAWFTNNHTSPFMQLEGLMSVVFSLFRRLSSSMQTPLLLPVARSFGT